MQKINTGQFTPDSSMTLKDFVELSYLPWAKAEHRASTYKGYREIWENQIRDRIGNMYLREIRTVHVSRMLRVIAAEKDLTKTTLQHFKSVLSGIFTYAKNEGAFDGVNPVQGAMIPSKAREPGETSGYNLTQILQIPGILPLLPKSAVAMASFAGLCEGELRGVQWPDYIGTELSVNRSIWKAVVNQPKTRASRDAVPVISALAVILDDYRRSMGNPRGGVIFHSGGRRAYGHGQAGTASHSSGNRGPRSAVVWMARVSTRHRFEPLRTRRERQSRATHTASFQATRDQGTLHQSIRSRCDRGNAEDASNSRRAKAVASKWPADLFANSW